MKQYFERLNEDEFGNLLWAVENNEEILCGTSASVWVDNRGFK